LSRALEPFAPPGFLTSNRPAALIPLRCVLENFAEAPRGFAGQVLGALAHGIGSLRSLNAGRFGK